MVHCRNKANIDYANIIEQKRDTAAQKDHRSINATDASFKTERGLSDTSTERAILI